MSGRPAALLFAFFALLSTPPALLPQAAPAAAPAVDARISHVISGLERVRPILQTALSPDGRRIAWVVAADGGAEIEVASLTGALQPRRLTSGTGSNCYENDLAWAPDSQELAFASDCNAAGGQADIYLAPVAETVSPRRLTHLRGPLHALGFSPDGKQIAFLYVAGGTRPAGALAAMKPPSGVIGVEGLEVQGVAAVDAVSGVFRQVTPPGLHVYEYAWGPDSRQLAFIAAPPPGEDNWWVAQLYTQSLNGGEPRSIFAPESSPGPLHGLQIAEPRWSPDGRQIAFIGGLMSDQGVTGGDIYRVPSAGGEARDLTPGRQSTPVWFHWMQDPTPREGGSQTPSDRIEWVEIEGGSMHRAAIGLLTGKTIPDRAITFDGSVGDGATEGAFSVSDDQSAFAYVRSSFSSPPEVMLTREDGAHRQTRQITHVNDAFSPEWGKAESLSWTRESFPIQGWLIYPVHYDPAKKYPLIVSVHGGPSGAVTPHWPGVGYDPVVFSALGYFVLLPNPRGSYGQGEAFTQANRRDFGYGDLRDILGGVDTVSARLPIDPQRVGITGWSYGGFMTMFAVTQTHRFRAAVAGAGISNWQSYYGENSIDQWMIPFFGASVYDDPAVYAKSSAINSIRNARTPTLIVVGDRDGECPAPQSFEFWHALRAQNVPTELVVYPGEGHGFRSPEHRLDVLERAFRWFEQYMN